MYSYYNNGRFSFPPNFDFNIIPGKDSPTTIISVIGESDLFSVINKTEMFEDLTSSSMTPMNIIPPFRNEFSSEHSSSYLTGFYCEKHKIVFIHLRSLNDSDLLLNTHKTFTNEKLKENFYDIEDSVYLKFVYYLFLLSDFILINVVGLNFDPYYIELFSQVNILRKKFKSLTENELKTISNSLEVTNNGRLVQPRLLFIFNLPTSPITNLLKQKPGNLLSLRERIEEKLYAVLKYHNVCGSEYCLAKVQTNCPFVFIRLPSSNSSRTFSDLLSHFVDNGFNFDSIIQRDRDEQSKAFEKFLTDQIYTFSVTKESSGFGSENISCRNWFKACHKLYNLFCSDKFRFTDSLFNHRYVFFKKGCELALSVAENHYKDGLPTQYSRDVHCDKAKAARQILLSIAKGPNLLPCVKKLEENLNKVWAVGRQICEAISVTRQRCKHEVHLLPDEEQSSSSSLSWDADNQQTTTTTTLFGNNTGGGGGGGEGEDNNNYGLLLYGRENCEPAVKSVANDKRNNNLPHMKHCSEVQLVSACNCGRRQGTRRDPFDYKEGNYIFYEQMTELCCYRFNRVALPENTRIIPSLLDSSVGGGAGGNEMLSSSSVLVVMEKKFSNSKMKAAASFEEFDMSDQSEHGMESLSPGDLSLSQTNNKQLLPRSRRIETSISSTDERIMIIPDEYQNESGEAQTDDSVSCHSDGLGGGGGGGGDSNDDGNCDGDGNDGDNDDDHDDDDDNNNSSTASIHKPEPPIESGPVQKSIFYGMFTLNEDPRKMPRFPSWNLIDSGPYFSYTHSSGLEYSGFVHGSNFLLPWDVPLKTRINKVRKQRVKRAFAAGNFVKAFLGFEMECPVGHRFFLAGPDNMMQGSMASHQVKEAVNGLLTRDIPLYYPCQCSTYLAQLMRIYVAVPNSNLLKLFIQPKVRPGPAGETPIFTPGSDLPIELEPGHLWVLRLPFAYEHNGQIYRQQADMRIVEECKLLKESIFYEEILDADE